MACGGGTGIPGFGNRTYEDYLSEVVQTPTSPYLTNRRRRMSSDTDDYGDIADDEEGDDEDDEELLVDDDDEEEEDEGEDVIARHSGVMEAFVVRPSPQQVQQQSSSIPHRTRPIRRHAHQPSQHHHQQHGHHQQHQPGQDQPGQHQRHAQPHHHHQQQPAHGQHLQPSRPQKETPVASITVVHKMEQQQQQQQQTPAGANPAGTNNNDPAAGTHTQVLSPFSPLLKQRQSQHPSQQQQLSLGGCRKVSVVVRVDAPIANANNNNHKNNGSHDGSSSPSPPKVCLFPMVVPNTTAVNNKKTNKGRSSANKHNHKAEEKEEVTDPAAADRFLSPKSSLSREDDGDDDESPSAKSSAFWRQLDSSNHNNHPDTTTPTHQEAAADDADGVRYSTRDVVVVNPTAFGTHIPSEITLERARLVSQVAQIASEDWIRTYRFADVVWPTTEPSSSSAPSPPSSSTLVPLCRAIAADVAEPGSISVRTVVSVGQSVTQLVATSTSGNDTYSKTTALFGKVARDSVAQVLSTSTATDREALDYYGLVGVTAQSILTEFAAHSSADGRPRAQLTLSVLEVSEDDALYDLQKTKPFHPQNLVQLRHTGGFEHNNNNTDSSHGGATLHGMLDHPVDTLKGVGRCLRRALNMAYHPKRTTSNRHGGSILAILKVWREQPGDGTGTTAKCTSMAQFLDVAHVPSYAIEAGAAAAASMGSPQPKTGSPHPVIGSPGLADEMMASPLKQRQAMVRRHAAARQSVTALGTVLRRLLLQEAGNDTVLSFRDHTLTKVLQKSFQQADSKIVVLASVSPVVDDYEATLQTLRYVHGISASLNPRNVLVSPFDNNAANSKTTSPTSRSLTEDDNTADEGGGGGDDGYGDDSLSFRLGLMDGGRGTQLNPGLLKHLVGDPRQRMARLLPQRRKKRTGADDGDGGAELDDGGEYTPTRYLSVDPGRVGDEFDRRAEELWILEQQQQAAAAAAAALAGLDVDENKYHDVMDDDDVDDAAVLPTPLIQNHSMEQNYWPGGVDPPDAIQEHEDEVPPSRRRRKPLEPLETSLDLDAMERGNNDNTATTLYMTDSNLHDDPSPLTADTREQLLKHAHCWQRQQQHGFRGATTPAASDFESDPIARDRHYISGSGARHERSMSQQLEDLSIELREKTQQGVSIEQAGVEAVIARNSGNEALYEAMAAAQELEQLRCDVETRDEHIQQLNDSLHQLTEQQQTLISAQASNDTEEEKVAELVAKVEMEGAAKRNELERALREQKEQMEQQNEQVQRLQQELELAGDDSGSKEQEQQLHHELDLVKDELARRDLQVQQLQAESHLLKPSRSYDTENERLQRQLDVVQQQLKRRDQEVEQLQTSQHLQLSQRVATGRVETTPASSSDATDVEKRQLQRQLESVQENLQRRSQDVQRLEQSLSSKRRLADQQADLLQRQLERAQEQLDSRNQQLQDLQLIMQKNNLEQDQLLRTERDRLEQQASGKQSHLREELESLRQLAERRDDELAQLHRQALEEQEEDDNQLNQAVAQLSSERDQADQEAREARLQLQLVQEEHEQQISHLEDEARRLERSVESNQLLGKSQETALQAERDRAEREAREAKQQLEEERQKARVDLQRREEELRQLREVSERLKQQYQSSRDEQVSTLAAERDEAMQEARAARQDTESEIQEYRRAVELRNEEVQQLRDALERTRLDQQSREEELAAQRDHAVEQSQSARDQLERELERLGNNRDEQVVRLQELLETTKRQYEESQRSMAEELEAARGKTESNVQHVQRQVEDLRLTLQSRDARISELQEFTDKARRQYQQAKEDLEGDVVLERQEVEQLRSVRSELERENDTQRVDVNRREEEVRQLQAAVETAQRKLELSKQETKAEREKVEHLSLNSKQLLNLEMEGYDLELTRRDEEILTLRETLERTQRYYEQEWKEQTESEMAMEVEKAGKKLAQVEQQSEMDAEVYRQELEIRDEKIRELEATLRKLQAELAEALNLADEAIVNQAETEKRVAELERQLSSQAVHSIDHDKFQELEESHAAVSKELHETSGECFRYKTELTDTRLALTELQFNFHSVEQERDHVIQKDSDRKREAEQLHSQLLEVEAEQARLQQENDRLAHELQVMESERYNGDAELQRQLAEKNESCRQHLKELELLREELATVLDDQMSLSNHELSSLRGRLSEAETAAAESRERCRELEQQLSAQVQARDELVAELDQTRNDLGSRLSDVEELSSNLNHILEEREEAVSKVGNLKQALTDFQDATRTRVEKFVHHRSETKVLLEKTLEENDALVEKNQELQAVLDELRNGTSGGGVSRDESLSMLKKAREENIELGKTIRKLHEGFKDRDRLARFQQRQRQLDASRLGRTDSIDSRDSFYDVPASNAETLLKKTLKENANLAAENRKLRDHDGMHPAASTSPLADELPLGSTTADAMVASIALAAKRTVDKSHAERNFLREELRAKKREVMDSLTPRIRSLERHVGDSGYERGVGSEEEKYDALVKRVRALERSVDADGARVYRGGRYER